MCIPRIFQPQFSFPVRSNSTTYSLILPGKVLHLIPSHTCPGWPPATRTGWRTWPWCPSQVGRGSRIFQPQFPTLPLPYKTLQLVYRTLNLQESTESYSYLQSTWILEIDFIWTKCTIFSTCPTVTAAEQPTSGHFSEENQALNWTLACERPTLQCDQLWPGTTLKELVIFWGCWRQFSMWDAAVVNWPFCV